MLGKVPAPSTSLTSTLYIQHTDGNSSRGQFQHNFGTSEYDFEFAGNLTYVLVSYVRQSTDRET